VGGHPKGLAESAVTGFHINHYMVLMEEYTPPPGASSQGVGRKRALYQWQDGCGSGRRAVEQDLLESGATK
jgi:hypothetical protein